MRQGRFGRVFQLGNDPLRQHLPQFHAPLVIRIDRPDRALREHVVLIQRHQRTQDIRCQRLGQNKVGGPVPFGHPERDLKFRVAFSGKLLGGLAESQRLRLREQIGHQQIVMVGQRA